MALTITINISDIDQLALENDLLDLDKWVQDAVAGKINSCRKRMIKEWQPKLFTDPSVTTIPATEDEFIQTVVIRDDYLNRVSREN